MKIISFVNNNSGPAYHRIITPLLLMPDVDVYITNNLLEEHFNKGCDLFIYNRILPDHAMPMIAKLKAKHGFKICVDVDDYWELDPHHILYKIYQEENFASQQLQHIVAADIVTTTHDRLAAEIKPYNKNVFILPNAIPKAGQFDIEKEHSQLTRLFWQGSITHREDIALLQRPIECLGSIAGKIKMVMAGFMEGEPEWNVMTSDYTAKYKHQYHILPGCHVNEYYNHYKHADVCLIPLINSPFNRLKSNLKILEAANLGLPCIVSDVHPYKGLPVLYARNSSDWVRHIQRLVASKKRQREAGEILREFCNQYYNFDKINLERKQIFESVRHLQKSEP